MIEHRIGSWRDKCLLRINDPDLDNVVLFCHGFPGTNRLPGMERALLDRGVALAELEYRGDIAAEGLFSFLGCQIDMYTAAAFLRGEGKVLTTLAYSMSGMVALQVLKRYHDHMLACAHAGINAPEYLQRIAGVLGRPVLLNPVSDSTLFGDAEVMGPLWELAATRLRLKDSYIDEIKALASPGGTLNPEMYIADLDVPMTIVQSECDEVVSPDYAIRAAARNPRIKLAIVPGATHDLKGDEPELIRELV